MSCCCVVLHIVCVISSCTIIPCLLVMIPHQPVVKLTGINGGHREEVQQEQQHRRRRAWFCHPPASSSEASHPARPIYNIPSNGRERAERGLVVPETVAHLNLGTAAEAQQQPEEGGKRGRWCSVYRVRCLGAGGVSATALSPPADSQSGCW